MQKKFVSPLVQVLSRKGLLRDVIQESLQILQMERNTHLTSWQIFFRLSENLQDKLTETASKYRGGAGVAAAYVGAALGYLESDFVQRSEVMCPIRGRKSAGFKL